MVADIAGAYHCVEVEQQTAFLQLMHYFHDPPISSSPRIFKRDRQAFGDPAAAVGLEILCIKFVAAVFILAVSRFLIENIRYEDNLKEYQEVKKELICNFSLYSLPPKYVVTAEKYDPDVMKDPVRRAERIEKCLGIQWDLVSDCVSAIPRYNIYG